MAKFLAKAAQAARGRSARLRRSLSKEHVKGLFSTRSFQAGSYTAIACIAVIGIAIAAVAAVEALPASITKIDISQEQTSSISDETREYLQQLDEDVTLYLIAEEGSEDEYLSILLDKYAAASDRVHVEQKDPVLYPGFTGQYTDEELNANSVIAVCGEDFRVIDYYDIYTLDSATYSYTFSGEAAVTSAIKAMTSDELPIAYMLQGHGEAALPEDAANSIELSNIQTKTLNLLSETDVPDDADAVIIWAPESDISDEEKDALLSYLQQGGSLLLATDYDTYSEEAMPNLADLMDAYGLQGQSGLVIEGDAARCLGGYPYYLLPSVGQSEAAGNAASDNSFVLFPLAHGIEEIENYRSSLEIEAILSTSSSAYVKTDPANAETLGKEDGDVNGTFMVGAAVSEETDEGTSRVVWFSSSQFADAQVDMRVGGANTDLLTSAVAWAAGDASAAASDGKGMGASRIMMDSSTSSILSVLLIGVIPLALLVRGFTIWRSRRSR